MRDTRQQAGSAPLLVPLHDYCAATAKSAEPFGDRYCCGASSSPQKPLPLTPQGETKASPTPRGHLPAGAGL